MKTVVALGQGKRAVCAALAAAVVLWGGGALRAAGRAPAKTPKLRILAGPYLQHVTRTSMTIMWETDRPAYGAALFGEARFLPKPPKGRKKEAPLDRRAAIGRTNTIHEIVLTGLKPQTDYFYQVVSRTPDGAEVRSEVFTFQTAVRPDSPFAFVVMGDTRSSPERFGRLAKLAWGERPNFVLNVGDVVENGENKSQWIKQFLAPAAGLMARAPTYVAIGNHERNAKWYYYYAGYPKPENYYSFDFGNAHFTIVDSNADLRPGSRQYEWLARDLASSRARWKFVAHHHPPYSSDEDDYGDTRVELSTRSDPRTRGLIPLYERYNVDIVWSGHIHDYERTWPIRAGKVDEKRGVIYIQTGGGGAGLENFAPTRSWFTAKTLRNWQYCLVTIHGGTLRMMAYDIDGRMYDFLELRK